VQETEGQQLSTRRIFSLTAGWKRWHAPFYTLNRKIKRGRKQGQIYKDTRGSPQHPSKIAAKIHNRLIHTTSHKLGTMLLSYIGISRGDAERSRLNQNKPNNPKMTNKCTNM
jgi:hypothetical protein